MKSSGGRSWKKVLFLIFGMVGFSFCLLTITAGYLLKQGIKHEGTTVNGAEFSDISVIWLERLQVDIGKISFHGWEDIRSSKTKSTSYSTILHLIRLFPHIFSKITVHDLEVANLQGRFLFERQADRSYLCDLISAEAELRSTLTFEPGWLSVEIEKVRSSRFRLDGTGDIRVQYSGGEELFSGSLNIDIASNIPVKFTLSGNDKKFVFRGSEAGQIHSIKPLVELFGLNDNIQRWITTYLKGSRFILKTVQGEYEWDDPAKVITTLHVEARVNDCEYTLALGFEPIKAKFTDFVFKDGVLTIKPAQSSFYGQSGGNSWLDIRFNDPARIILTANIKTSAVANDDILSLLDYYKISLPFKQLGGTTKTDLTLTINLNDIKAKVQGSFEIKDATIEYNDGKYLVPRARVRIDNSDITIDHFEVGLKDLWLADISGTFFLKKSIGDLSIEVKQVSIPLNESGEPQLILDRARPHPIFTYRIRPEGHTIEGGLSNWLVSGIPVEISPFSAPFYLDNFGALLDGVQLKTVPGATISVSGALSIKEKSADLHCILHKFQIGGLLLEDKQLPLDVVFGDGIDITIKEEALWSMNSIPASLTPFKISYRDNVLLATTARFIYGDLLNTLISGDYNTKSKKGLLSLEKVSLNNRKLHAGLVLDEGFIIQLNGDRQNFIVTISDFDFEVTRDLDNNWSLKLNDLSAFHRYSALLQKYQIREGFIQISLASGEAPFAFTAEIKTPYPILIDESGPVDMLTITGEATRSGFSATVNDTMSVDYAGFTLHVKSKQLGFNIPALVTLVKERNDSLPKDSANEEKEQIRFSLIAGDSHLFFSSKSRILADYLSLEMHEDKVTMDLKYGSGLIQFEMAGDTFSLEGDGLNDKFMGALIAGARFENGAMAMAAQGSFEQFSVIFEVKDTILKHLKTVNNIMAFINTVPALTTFSLPGYSTTGLVVDYAVVGMAFNGKNATIESIEIDSSQMNVVGAGSMDFFEQLINLDLKLISQAKSNLGKIPVVGYIVGGGKEKRSKAINISGSFNDPVVKHSLLRNFIAQPVKMLARILSLPFYLVKNIAQSSGERRKTQSVE